ncbi:MAG: chemotaxis protein CheW [Chloroflexota bacterium]
MSANEQHALLTFRLSDQYYALRIQHVLEVAAMVEYDKLANADEALLGIANRHGDPLPLLDMRAVFGMSAIAVDVNTLFIVVQTSGYPVGLVVDEVEQVRYVPLNAFRSARAGTYITHLVSTDDQLFQLVDLDTLLQQYVTPTQS